MLTPSIDLAAVVERFDHVAVAVHDIGAVLPLVELLGGRFRNGGDNERGGFRWAQWFLPGAGKIEVLQPLDPEDDDHFLVRFLADRGEGVHHVTFKVHDLDEAVAQAKTRGYEVVGVHAEPGPWREAFLHPRRAHGMLVQFAEWTDREPPPGTSIAQVLRGAV